MNIVAHSIGTKRCFSRFSYYIGNNHPCINVRFIGYNNIEFKIDFCKNGNVNISYKYTNDHDKEKPSKYIILEQIKFEYNEDIGLKKNASKFINKLINNAIFILEQNDIHFYKDTDLWHKKNHKDFTVNQYWRNEFLIRLIRRLATLAIKKNNIDKLNIELKSITYISFHKKSLKSFIKVYIPNNLIFMNFDKNYKDKYSKDFYNKNTYSLSEINDIQGHSYKIQKIREKVQIAINKWKFNIKNEL